MLHSCHLKKHFQVLIKYTFSSNFPSALHFRCIGHVHQALYNWGANDDNINLNFLLFFSFQPVMTSDCSSEHVIANVFGFCCVLNTTLKILYEPSHLIQSTTSWDLSSIINSLLVRKLRVRVVKSLAQDYTISMWWHKELNPCFWLESTFNHNTTLKIKLSWDTNVIFLISS